MADRPDSWRRLGAEAVGDYERFKVVRVRSRSPRTGKAFDFDVLELADWVNVVALTDDGRLVLSEQYRHGKQEHSLEFPSGAVEPDENPAEAGLRELKEETGYRAEHAELIGTVDPNTALQTNELHVVLAEGCRPTGEKSQDAAEDVRVRIVAPDDVLEMTANGQISHALAIATWHCYDRYRAGQG